MIKNTKFPLKLGSNGKAVQIIQLKLGLQTTGIYDKITQKLVMSKLGMTEVGSAYFMSIFTEIPANEKDDNFPIQVFSAGFYVKCLEILLGIEQSGKFDWKTDQALLKATGNSHLRYNDFLILMCQTLGIDQNSIVLY